MTLLAILLAGGAVRALPIRSGMPYPSYVDEHFVLRPAAHMIADRTWYPGRSSLNYPPLTMYATVMASGVLQVLPGGGSVGAGARATVKQPIASSILSADLIFGGRLAVLAFGIGTVLMSALLAAHLMGRRAGVVAALLTATTPALVTRSAIVIVDTPAAFFATASLLCASIMHGARRRVLLWAAMAGAAAGFAVAAKYTVGVVIVGVMGVVALSVRRSLEERLAMAGVSLASWAAAAAVAAPTLVLRTHAVREELRHQADVYASKTTPTYWHELLRGREVGPLLLVAAVIGCVALLWHRRSRPVIVGALLFALALLLPLTSKSYQPFRNVLPLVPLVGVAAAAGIVAAVDAVGRRARLSLRPRAAIMAAIGVAVCMVMIGSAASYYDEARIDIHNSRVDARRWLAEHTHAGDHILVAQELAFVPRELARIPGHVTVRPLLTKQAHDADTRFDYVVVGDRPSSQPWRDALVDRMLSVRYGNRPTFTHPRASRLPQQIVRVFAGPGSRDPRQCSPLCG